MSRRTQSRDAGMTLPELLISVTLTGVLVASMAMSISVMLRQSDNTAGRVNNARSEQNVNVWMPSDLASAETADTTPGASPCAPDCPGGDIPGTNALMLIWSGTVPGPGGTAVPTLTKVSYRYVLVGTEYQMIRVECVSIDSATPTCRTNTVLHDLDPPPPNVNYIEGKVKPTWIMVVSQALDPGDLTGSTPIPVDDPTFKNKNGQRVVVTINGGGDVAGAGGGHNEISLSAGGTERNSELSPGSVSFNQTLTAARSRCGGNFGLVIDTSGSIDQADPTNMSTARAAITSMIDTFAGTPVKLEVSQFSTLAKILGAAANGSRYFDMLKESDVDDLKKYVNGGKTSTGVTVPALVSSGSTNYEDALYRMFRNTDGTIQAYLPSKVIFFTDGIPNFTRLGYGSTSGTTALPAAVDNPDDSGLAAAQGGSYAQVAWNRANRIAREFGVQVDYIGVFVGDDTTASSSWTDINAGYQLINWRRGYHNIWEKGSHDDYQRNNNIVWEQGYHLDYQRGGNVVWERGYHDDYQRGNNVIWERAFHTDYQQANNVIFQYATSGVTYEQYVTTTSTWTGETALNYITLNQDSTSNDNHRIRITGTPGGWTTMTAAQVTAGAYVKTNTASGQADGFKTSTSGTATSWVTISAAAFNLSNTTTDTTDGFNDKWYTAPYSSWEATTQALYDPANTTTDATDGWRTRQTVASTSWTSVTATQYNASNTAPDSTDGWQIARIYTSPYNSWEATTQGTYSASNTTSASTDGWRTRDASPSTTWTSVTSTEYNASNTTADASDGWQTVNATTSPFTLWQATTQAAYDPANTTADATDGWRTRLPSTNTNWTSVSVDAYNASNTTSTSTDGWRVVVTYSAPYTKWASTTQSAYNTSNTTADESDGWRAIPVYTSPYSSWVNVDEATYLANKTPGLDPTNTSDGWTATKLYEPPYTGYDASHTYSKPNREILGDLIDPAGLVDPLKDAGGNVTNAEVANMYSSTQWSDIQAALKAIALGQCGGTLTLQTRINGTTPANDTFTYENTLDSTVVETSSSKRSGTFDFSIPTGGSVSPEIQQSKSSSMKHYAPAVPAWTCKAAGLPVTPTIIDVPNSPWDNIRLNIGANQAVSCIQNVTWVP